MSINNICSSLIFAPYREGANYLRASISSSPTPLTKRIAYLATGIALHIPLLNAIILVALRAFSSRSSDNEMRPFTQTESQHENYPPNRQVVIIPHQSAPLYEMVLFNANVGNEIVRFNDKGEVFDRVLRLTEAGHLVDAWDLYTRAINGTLNEVHDSRHLRLRSGAPLPPEQLIFHKLGMEAMLRRDSITIADKFSPELLRDCAIAYNSCFTKCFENDNLWNCFIGSPEYIADIGKHTPLYAFNIITSARGDTLTADKHRFELFNAAHPHILASIADHTMSDDQVKRLGFYLLRYREVVSHDDFDRIKTIVTALKERGTDSQELAQTIDLVLAKLSFQGIYKSGQNLFQDFGFDALSEIFPIGYLETEQNELAQRISSLEINEHLQMGIIYLSLIPKNNPNYIPANMLLGNFWIDQDECIEAGKHFLLAAQDPSARQEALMLAATNLLVRTGDSIYISRVASSETPKSLLNVNECKTFAEGPGVFFDLLRKQYADREDLLEIITNLAGEWFPQ